MTATIGTTQILRTPAAEYDIIAEITADRFDVPIALVNIDDGDDIWLKARVGLDLCSAPKHIAFCSHVLETGQPLIVEDLLADDRFVDHPLVVGEMGARFYAGAPLTDRKGKPFGTLCIIDRKPRIFFGARAPRADATGRAGDRPPGIERAPPAGTIRCRHRRDHHRRFRHL